LISYLYICVIINTWLEWTITSQKKNTPKKKRLLIIADNIACFSHAV
jgi:hypothetical protein